MKTKTIALSLGLILAAGALYAADPFEGTWKLNESKSKLTRGTGKNTKVVYDSRLIRDKMTVTVTASMQTESLSTCEWKGRFNGKDYEVTGDPNADMRSYTKVNDHNPQYDRQKGRQGRSPGPDRRVCRWKKPSRDCKRNHSEREKVYEHGRLRQRIIR
jgi:hypothetical protein